jgi:hypothetical protein
MKRAFFPAIAIVATGFSGCYYDIEEELYPATFCDTQNVTWSATIQPLVQNRCAIPGCHVAGATSPDLSSYQDVKAIADNGLMRTVVVNDRTMPQNSTLPSCSIEQVRIWLDAGAPEN